jgi:hypothetical protein
MVSRLISLSVLDYFGQFLRPTAAYIGMLAVVLGTSAVLADWAPVWRLLVEILVGAIAYSGLILCLCRERTLFLVKTVLHGRRRPAPQAA